MARIHVLEFNPATSRVRVVVHTPVPLGNNGAGVPWKEAYVSCGLATTILTEGTLRGQITTAEKAQVLTGDVIEIVGEMKPPAVAEGAAALTARVTAADIDAFAQKLIDERFSILQVRLNFAGFTR